MMSFARASVRVSVVMAAMVVAVPMMPLVAQATGGQRSAGTVKSTSATGLTLTTAAGQEVVVTVPDAVKVMVVAPGSKDLKSATAGTLSDVTVGDKVLVVGDAAAGTIVMASGMKTVTVKVTPETVVRRYAGNSVRFADAKVSSMGEIHAGDQLRVRGTKSADGSTITADELVTGMFKNYSGLIASVDATAGTVTLKDLATKKTVTVAVGANSDVRRIPAMMAERVAARMSGGGGGARGGAAAGAAAGAPAGPPAGPPAGQGMHAGPMGPGGPGDGAQRERSAGSDLSQMLSRLPTETLAGLKAGDAVMIVATSPATETETPMAVTLLVGVDAILRASPKGETMTLSPWSLGGGAGGEGGGDGGGPGR